MWHDNETEIDLVGYDRLVDTLLYLVRREELRPLTIGVFGDWGSGKSSVLRMAFNALQNDEKYLCVWFSPWLHKDFEDVKAALMVSVLTALNADRPILRQLEEGAKQKVQTLWNSLAKRVDWFRLFGFTAKNVAGGAMLLGGHPGGIALHASSLGDLGHLYRPGEPVPSRGDAHAPESSSGGEHHKTDEDVSKLFKDAKESSAEPKKVFEQSIDDFRADFTKLLSELQTTLVVFIDDIDRCLPTSIVDILEALKLFLAVPGTDFIIAADERVIRHAVETRYPEMSAHAHRIGRDYLEKIVQLPVYIPPLTPDETETYLNLLTLQASEAVSLAQFEVLVDRASVNRKRHSLDVAMNYGIARSTIEMLPVELEQAMQLVQRVSGVLCTQLEGNPRRIKRFFNTLYLRRYVAESRGVKLDIAALAKLMMLEYFYPAFFAQLYEWQLKGQGKANELKPIEDAIASGDESAITTVLSSLKLSQHESGIRAALSIAPSLSNVNLAPYFYFCRDRNALSGGVGGRLSQQLQEILVEVQSDSDAQRLLALEKANQLSPSELKSLYESILALFRQTPDNDNLEKAVVSVAAAHAELVPIMASGLELIPPAAVRASLVMLIGAEMQQRPAELLALLKAWAGSSNGRLSAAAKKVLAA